MTNDDFLTFGRPVIEEPEIAEVVDSLRSGWIGTGPKVGRFERMLEDYLGVAHVRCVNSGTAALTLGMKALGIGPGDEVIVPSMTFVSSASAVLHTGADVVLVDCEPETGLIDLAAAEAAIGERTKALIVVHLAGAPVDMDRVAAVRDRHGLLVVEDAAHAIGASWGDRMIGTHSDVCAYSFYATKNITTGEGGAVATADAGVAETVERLAMHGLSAGAWQRYSDPGFVHYEVQELGHKQNMTDLQAALGLHQLPRLDGWIAERTERWRRYDELLADLPLELPPATAEPGAGRHARHLYRVAVERDAEIGRDELIERLTAAGIGVGVHYRGVHLQPYFARRYDLAPESLPVANDMSARTLSLPLSPTLTDDQQRAVADALRRALWRR